MTIGLGYILLIAILGGLTGNHIMMGCLALLDYWNKKTRLFLKYFFPFMLTGIVYDSMRYYYWWGISGHIHVAEPYLLEKTLFGIRAGESVLTSNEFFVAHTWSIADLFCGFAYLVFVVEYLSAAFLLFFSSRLTLLRTFGWCFFLVNVMGFATYYIYPAAPPWYVTQYGLGPARLDVHASASAASRFDALLGTHFFDAWYGAAVDVYGAIPSLHVAYPLLVAWVAFVCRWGRLPAVLFYILMCFSAVYLQHHYIIDVVLGSTYAVAALLLVRTAEKAACAEPAELEQTLPSI